MKFYRIEGGPVRIGPSMKIHLSKVQHRGREHMVEIQKKAGDGLIVLSNQGMDFKSGEVIGLADDPPKHLAEQFVEVKEGEATEAWKKLAVDDAERAGLAQHSAEARRAALAKQDAAIAKAGGEPARAPAPVKVEEKTETEFNRKPADSKK